MDYLKEKMQKYSKVYHKITSDKEFASKIALPGNTFFIENDEILTIPREDGDSRYPYGSEGFNFWAYSSGYMHCNDGLFSPFLRAGDGQEPKIAFFAGITKDEEQYEVVSLLPVPIMGNDEKDLQRYTIFTKSSVYYITEVKDFCFAVRVFVDGEKNIYFTASAENLSDSPKQFYISSYFNPFLMHDIVENGENKWFRYVQYCKDKNEDGLGTFVIRTNEDLSRTVSLSNYGILLRNHELGQGSKILHHEETTSRYQYVGGTRSSLSTPRSLKKGTFGEPRHKCEFTEIGIAGDIVHIELNGKESFRYDISLKYLEHRREELNLEEYTENKPDKNHIDTLLKNMEKLESEKHQVLTCKVRNEKEGPVKDNIFNSFFENLKKQVEFCSLIKGYVQLSAGSLIGIRDVFQALEGLLIWQPEAARKKMLEALSFVAPNGRCPRQYSLPSGEGIAPAMDLRPFIDQGVWVISTIISYLRYTKDFEFLKEDCGYYDIVDEKKKIVIKSDIRDSVLDHMFKIMNYLITNRDTEKTGCVLALYGDWNDALDGLGVSSDPNKEYGTGVSVMASLQVYQNLHEMIELIGLLDSEKYKEYIVTYKKVAEEIREGLEKYAVIKNNEGHERIVHGWGDNMSYYVGGFNDPDQKSRYSLTSNAFWVLSKLYDEDMSIKDTILKAFENLDSKYGLKTFEPHFEPGTKGVGRIYKLPKGTAENGATYIHASVFAVSALFRMGCPEEAWEQLFKLFPFTHEYVSCSPFVMPNSYGYNKEKFIDGESMLDWQTGSSNVMFKLLMKYVFGISPEFEGIWIQPAAWVPFEGFEVSINIGGCNVKMIYKSNNSADRIFKVNGIEKESIFDNVMYLNKLWIGNDELKTNEDLVIEIM